ncbi:MAG: hypothetical protein A3F10_05465 [Coxiella sp. RIFCSPHIGHO2_12_FULL_42_15]|nr:MAG: hypothetical protein A3F10_05465 [Coxiella sp. RIFCSPHIGHO2_12_FULL_42_15]
MSNNYYEKQVALLLDALPFIAKESCFAVKGGTAINLFLRDMPRLSVDIDLTYLPLESREITLTHLAAALNKIALNIEQHLPNAAVIKHFTVRDRRLTKLFVTQQNVQIVVEPNEILRGSVFSPVKTDLCNQAKNRFERNLVDIKVLSTADLYAGKICAALDRQHARDLFDIKLLFENEGITDQIRQAFIIYLASSPRPMHELLQPNLIDIRSTFEKEFSGMTLTPTSHEELSAAREKLIETISSQLTHSERRFLLSVKQGEPQWDLLNIPGIENLPALQWKVMNVKKLPENKKKELIQKLENVLQL